MADRQYLRAVDKKERNAGINRERELHDEEFAENVRGCAAILLLLLVLVLHVLF